MFGSVIPRIRRNLPLAVALPMLTAGSASAQMPGPDECTGDDPVDGVNWGIEDDGLGRTYVIGGGAIFKSCDDGDTWTRSAGSLQSGTALLIDPVDPAIVYFGVDNGVYRSRDHGASFELTGVSSITARVFALAGRADGTIFAGTADGVWSSTDQGESWTRMNGSPTGESIRSILVDPGDANRLFVGGGNGLFYETTDGGASWRRIGGFTQPVNTLLFDPLNAAVIYAAAWDGVHRSADGGTTWNNLGGVRNMDMTFDPNNPATAYRVSRLDGALKSVDGGQTWSPINSGLDLVRNDLYRIHVLPTGRLLVGTEFGGVYKSDDGGASWARTGAVNEDGGPGPQADLRVSLRVHDDDNSVKAGKNVKITVTITNHGPDASTNTVAEVRWNDSSGFAPNYSLSTDQGYCRDSIAVPFCALGTIPRGGSVHITFRGQTTNNSSRTYYFRAFTNSAEDGDLNTAEVQVKTWVELNCILIFCTTSSNGGGSTGWLMLLLLGGAAVGRSRAARGSRARPRS